VSARRHSEHDRGDMVELRGPEEGMEGKQHKYTTEEASTRPEATVERGTCSHDHARQPLLAPATASRCGSHQPEERYWTTRRSRHCCSHAGRPGDRPPALPAAHRGHPGLLPAVSHWRRAEPEVCGQRCQRARPEWRAHATWPTLCACTASTWAAWRVAGRRGHRAWRAGGCRGHGMRRAREAVAEGCTASGGHRGHGMRRVHAAIAEGGAANVRGRRGGEGGAWRRGCRRWRTNLGRLGRHPLAQEHAHDSVVVRPARMDGPPAHVVQERDVA
jgi:hypothetical protein